MLLALEPEIMSCCSCECRTGGHIPLELCQPVRAFGKKNNGQVRVTRTAIGQEAQLEVTTTNIVSTMMVAQALPGNSDLCPRGWQLAPVATSTVFQNDALCCSVVKPAADSRPASATRTGAPVKIETEATLSFLGRLLRLFAAESHSSTDNQQITSRWEF